MDGTQGFPHGSQVLATERKLALNFSTLNPNVNITTAEHVGDGAVCRACKGSARPSVENSDSYWDGEMTRWERHQLGKNGDMNAP